MTNKTDKPKPKFRTYSIGGLVRSLEKEDFSKPQSAYEFSNGEKKVDTDRTTSGFYSR